MTYSQEELLEAKRQIDSTLHKLRETVKTLEGKENPTRYRSQITLAKRRIQAFSLAVTLIQRELDQISESQSRRATNCATPGYEVVRLLGVSSQTCV